MSTPSSRPLSPHLQVYRFSMLMAMSIIHRITGTGLYFGFALFAWWLIAAATGHQAYEVFYSYAGSIVGRLVLFAATWGLFHHMFGGIRHLIWDTGAGLAVPAAKNIARVCIILPLLLTIGVWVVGYCVK